MYHARDALEMVNDTVSVPLYRYRYVIFGRRAEHLAGQKARDDNEEGS